jgi:hypothetical protein
MAEFGPHNLPLGAAQDSGLGLADIHIIEDTNTEDSPVVDEKGNVLEIEHPDGSISISLDGRPIEEAEDDTYNDKWFANLVGKITSDDLSRIANDILRGVEEDKKTRQEWMENIANGMKLLGLKIELPNTQGAVDGAPIEGMSKIRHPLLLEAVLRFQANARSEMLPTDGPVKIRNDATSATFADDQLAEHLERDFNHYLTVTADEYYPDTDKMLFMLGFSGLAFKKVYFCPLRNRPVSETVDAEDVIVSNNTTTLKSAKRVTHRIMMSQNTVRRMQILNVYRDVALGTPKPVEKNSVKLEKNSIEGVSQDNYAQDRDREIYEVYCDLDIPGFEHKKGGKPTGLEIPYRVTIDVSSKEILSIVRNYNEETKDLPIARQQFVAYIFVPGFGFYPIGLLHILGNTANAVTAAWRELLDSGMYASFPGFLYSDVGGRQNSNIFRVPPGGGALIKTGGMPITQAVMPLPYKEPSSALATIADTMSQYGQRLGGTSEMPVGEGNLEAPVGTTIALIEQATKVINAVHKRMHSAQALEFQLIAQCFREHPESFWQFNDRPARKWSQEEFLQAINNCDLVPQADPNTASHTQRIMKVMALKQAQAANPSLYDSTAVDVAALKAAGWDNPQEFMRMPQPNEPPPPEIQKVMAELQIKQQDATSRAKVADAKAAELMSRVNGGVAGPDGNPQPSIQDHLELAKIAAEQKDAELKAQGSILDAINRKRDRESRERLAAMKFAEQMAMNPQGLAIASRIIDPSMLQRLESQEAPLQPTSQGIE